MDFDPLRLFEGQTAEFNDFVNGGNPTIDLMKFMEIGDPGTDGAANGNPTIELPSIPNIAAMRQEMTSLSEENGKLRAALQVAEEAAASASDLQRRVFELQDDNTMLRTELARLSDENQAKASELQRASEHVRSMEADIKRYEAHITTITAGVKTTQSQAEDHITSLEAEMQQLRKEKAEMQSELNIIRHSLNSTNSRSAATSQQYDALKAQICNVEEQNRRLVSFRNDICGTAEIALGVPSASLTGVTLQAAIQKLISEPKPQQSSTEQAYKIGFGASSSSNILGDNTGAPEYRNKVAQLVTNLENAERKKHKLASKVDLLTTQLDRMKTVFQENLVYMRKRFEQITGWRFNIESFDRFSCELRAGSTVGVTLEFIAESGGSLQLLKSDALSANGDLVEKYLSRQAPNNIPEILAALVLRYTGLRNM